MMGLGQGSAACTRRSMLLGLGAVLTAAAVPAATHRPMAAVPVVPVSGCASANPPPVGRVYGIALAFGRIL